MKYVNLGRNEHEGRLEELVAMPDFLAERLGSLDPEPAAKPGPAGSFSPVEHCWHLADLEREGFGVRISRLRTETAPHLADFPGNRLAVEREYRKKDLAEGIAAFRQARAKDVAVLASVEDADWSRAGTQEGVGPVMLCDLPSMMAQHDRSHRAEIENV
jgi:hypothetical protein